MPILRSLSEPQALSRKNQSVQDQAIEPVTTFRGKQPSEMNQAGAADSHSPQISSEPGEFACGRSAGAASISRAKATDFIHDPVGIGEGMVISPVLLGPLVRMRNRMTALAAKNQFLFALHRLVFGRLLRAVTWPSA